MELAGDVGRRHHDGEGLSALALSARRVGVEVFVVQPFLVELVLNPRRVVGCLLYTSRCV